MINSIQILLAGAIGLIVVLRGDQVLNANSLKARGLAHVMPQSELTAESLPPAIDALWADRELLRQRLAALPDADGTQLVLDQIHKYMKK